MSVIPQDIIASEEKGKDQVNFVNGSKIQFFTGNNPDSARGPSIDFIIMDEASLYPRESIETIAATVAARPNAKIILASTPKGKNDFYQYCKMAWDGDGFVKEWRMSYHDNPYYDKRFIEGMRKVMTEFMFKQEFDAQFVFGQGTVFGNFSKNQTVKEWPLYNPEQSYSFGIDVAGSGDDSTILTVLDKAGVVSYIYEAKEHNITHQATELANVIRDWNAAGYCETNGLGQGLYDALCLKPDIDVHPFIMSNTSKQDLVTQMLKDLADNVLQLPSIDIYPKLDNEMATYVVSRTNTGKLSYSHDKGGHDDAVDSLMIANLYRNEMLYSRSGFMDPDEMQNTPMIHWRHQRDYTDEY